MEYVDTFEGFYLGLERKLTDNKRDLRGVFS